MVTKVSESGPRCPDRRHINAIFKLTVQKIRILQGCVRAPKAGRQKDLGKGILRLAGTILWPGPSHFSVAVHVL